MSQNCVQKLGWLLSFRNCLSLLAVLFYLIQPGLVRADTDTTLAALSGERAVSLVDNKGERFSIGKLVVSEPDAQGVSEYQWHLDHHRFTDHFLSMKEMKCLQGPELWCFIPYPYDNPHRISATDLRWLEHDLLFLFKRNNEFGANFWNGIYYRFKLEQGALVGEARSLDLNMLASPPEDQSVPPIAEFDLDDADLDKRWLPRLEIR